MEQPQLIPAQVSRMRGRGNRHRLLELPVSLAVFRRQDRVLIFLAFVILLLV
jgi:hypothetical protein